LFNEEKEKLIAHDESYLFREAMRQFGQALTTNCLATSKLKERMATKGVKAQETSRLHKELERLQKELQLSKTSQQEAKQHLVVTTKTIVAEKEKLLAETTKLKEELSGQNEKFAKKIEACKQNAAHAFLMGFRRP